MYIITTFRYISNITGLHHKVFNYDRPKLLEDFLFKYFQSPYSEYVYEAINDTSYIHSYKLKQHEFTFTKIYVINIKIWVQCAYEDSQYLSINSDILTLTQLLII